MIQTATPPRLHIGNRAAYEAELGASISKAALSDFIVRRLDTEISAGNEPWQILSQFPRNGERAPVCNDVAAAVNELLIDTFIEQTPGTNISPRYRYNLLSLAQSLEGREVLIPTLTKLYKENLVTGEWNGVNLRDSLLAAIVKFQTDSSWSQVWNAEILRHGWSRAALVALHGAIWMPRDMGSNGRFNFDGAIEPFRLAALQLENHPERRIWFAKILLMPTTGYPTPESFLQGFERAGAFDKWPEWAADVAQEMFSRRTSDGRVDYLSWLGTMIAPSAGNETVLPLPRPAAPDTQSMRALSARLLEKIIPHLAPLYTVGDPRAALRGVGDAITRCRDICRELDGIRSWPPGGGNIIMVVTQLDQAKFEVSQCLPGHELPGWDGIVADCRALGAHFEGALQYLCRGEMDYWGAELKRLEVQIDQDLQPLLKTLQLDPAWRASERFLSEATVQPGNLWGWVQAYFMGVIPREAAIHQMADVGWELREFVIPYGIKLAEGKPWAVGMDPDIAQRLQNTAAAISSLVETYYRYGR